MITEYENIIIVSHGDTLSVFNAMWLGLNIEMLNKCSFFGMAGGVSFMQENADGKHVIKLKLNIHKNTVLIRNESYGIFMQTIRSGSCKVW